MKKLIKLTFAMMIFITLSCEKSATDPIEEKPPAIYNDIELNEINIITGTGYNWHVDDFDVTYQNSKLYFNIHTKKDFDASLYFILVNFAVDSFPFVVGSSNIVNLRYPTTNEYGSLVDEWATSYNGDFPSGYFVIDFIDTTELIVYGYFEFMNFNTSPDAWKLQKCYFKVNYELGSNSLDDNSADIFMNSENLNVIDIPIYNYFPRIHSYIVFEDNSAMHLFFFYDELEMGYNSLESPGFNAAWRVNVDFPDFYYTGTGHGVVYHADSGYVNVKTFDVDNQTIEGDINLYYKNDNLTGSFIINY